MIDCNATKQFQALLPLLTNSTTTETLHVYANDYNDAIGKICVIEKNGICATSLTKNKLEDVLY
jgi:hypothetical protein